MKSFLTVLPFALVLFASCENEIDVNAPFTETTVVYALLDTDSTNHYIRITRAYLGPDGITGGNQVGDSLYYDSLQVVLEGFDANQTLQQTMNAVRFNGFVLDSGFFTGQGYHVYRATGALNENYTYRITVHRPDGEDIVAETPLVHGFLVSRPQSFGHFNVMAVGGQDLTWAEAENGRIYQPKVHFRYIEFPENNPNDTTQHTLTYTLPTITGINLDGTNTIERSLTGLQFFNFLAGELNAPPPGYARLPKYIDFTVLAGGDALATHIRLNQPLGGINQDAPFFTNVTNGVGIVSSTRSEWVTDRPLATGSIDELVYGNLTCHLHFGKVTTTDTLYCQN